MSELSVFLEGLSDTKLKSVFTGLIRELWVRKFRVVMEVGSGDTKWWLVTPEEAKGSEAEG